MPPLEPKSYRAFEAYGYAPAYPVTTTEKIMAVLKPASILVVQRHAATRPIVR
jgi:hypothetical protein